MSRTCISNNRLGEVSSDKPSDVKEPPTSSEQTNGLSTSSDSEESIIAMSESQFFPTPSDSIWRSATIIKEPQPPQSSDFSELKQEDELREAFLKFALAESYPDDDGTLYAEEAKDLADLCEPRRQEPNEPDNHSLLPEDEASPVPENKANAQQQAVRTAVGNEAHASADTSATFSRGLQVKMANLAFPAADASAQEIEEALESGLRILDDLAHSDASRGNDLKEIYEAYYSFARALFQDIKEPSNSHGILDVNEDCVDEDSNVLEQQKNEICEREALLEKEILHYKATKQELLKITEDIEEASKAYHKPEVLEDVAIPVDVKLSSSSEYVAEIEELQKEVLRKQEMVKSLYRELQERHLPKDLVDSICESHRLAMQALRDIEDETTYLKECVNRLDLKYLYNLQKPDGT